MRLEQFSAAMPDMGSAADVAFEIITVPCETQTMKTIRHSREAIVAVSLLAIVVPWRSLPAASGPSARVSNESETVVRDVELQRGGTLAGHLVNGATGAPVAGARLELRNRRSNSAPEAVTDERGKFEFPNTKGGVYLLASSQSAGHVRAWSQGTAPPDAPKQILMVSGPVHRAHLIHWFRDLAPLGKLLVITGIAAAIVVPLYDAAHDDYPVWNSPPASGD